jgi:hypothetical protein
MRIIRGLAWGLFLVVGVLRPGVDALDRWLAQGCWDVPSQWNAVADVAIRTGVVDARIGDAPALWRHASIVPLGSSRIAAVTVSNMVRSRVSFLNERFEALAVLERSNPSADLVTDEARGYKPLSHIWPLRERDGRLVTLVGFQSLVSEPLSHGRFAYLALGSRQNEVLFACDLRWAPGPTWSVMDQIAGEGNDGFVLHAREYGPERKDAPPVATFVWDDHDHRYVGHLAEGAATFVSWWSTAPDNRALFTPEETVDDVVNRLMSKVEVSTDR